MASASIDLRSAEDVADVLNLTFQLIRARWRLFLKTVFYLGGAPLVLGIGCFGAGGLGLLYGGTALEAQSGLPGGTILAFVAAGLLSLVGTGLAITGVLAVVRLYVERGGESFGLGDVWSIAKSGVLGVIGIQILNGLAIFVLFPLAIIPCLGQLGWLGWMLFVTVRYFYLAVPLRVIERNSAFQAISRAGTLVKNYFWDTAGIFLAVYMVQTILSSAFVLPFQFLAFSGGLNNLDAASLPGWMLAGLGGLFLLAIAGSILMSGVMYIAAAVQAYSLKDRKEEAGVEARVEKLEEEAAERAEGLAATDGANRDEEGASGSNTDDMDASGEGR